MNTKLNQRIAKLEQQPIHHVDPLNIVVKFIEPGTLRVTSTMTFENGKWVRHEIRH